MGPILSTEKPQSLESTPQFIRSKRGIIKPVSVSFVLSLKQQAICSLDVLLLNKIVWKVVSEIFSLELGCDFHSIARFWPASKNKVDANYVSACALLSIWKIRKSRIFNNADWADIKQI